MSTHVWTPGGTLASATEILVDSYIPGAATVADGIQLAINAAQAQGTNGATLKFTSGKLYQLATGATGNGSAQGIPAFAKNVPCGVNLNGAILQASPNVKTAFTLNKISNGDTFTGISIENGMFDRNGQAASTSGLFGTVIPVVGTIQQINMDHFQFRRLKTIGASGTTLGSIQLIVSHPSSGLALNTITDIVIEDVDFAGGAIGMQVQGQGGTLGTGVEVFIDRVWIKNWKHDTLLTPVAFATGANIQIGSAGFCGKDIYIGHGYGAGTQDVGIELDQTLSAVIEDVEIKNNWNQALFCTNDFHAVQHGDQTAVINEQEVTWKNCKSTVTAPMSGAGKFAVKQTAGRAALGTYNYENCRFDRTDTSAIPTLSAGEAMSLGGVGAAGVTVDGINIKNFTSNIQGQAGGAGAATAVIAGILLATAPTVTPVVKIDGWNSILNGSQGAGALTVRHLQIEGAAQLDATGFMFDHQVTGQTGNTNLITLGAVGATLNGNLSKGFVRRFTGTAAPFGPNVSGTATLTVTNELLINDWDFRNLTGGGGTEVRFNAAQNRNKVRTLRNKYVVYPRLQAAMSTTNFTAAAWTTATANQYLGGDDAVILFAGGSGAGITAIDVSADNVTYSNILTQAAAAMPAGGVAVFVKNGMWLKVTFTTTQPTTSILFQ